MHPPSALAGAAVAVLVGVAGHACAAPFVAGPWTGSVEGVADLSRVDIETRGSPKERFESMRTEERVTLRNAGAYLYDPQLLSITAGATFGLTQLDFSSATEEDFKSGELKGYDVTANILSNRPFSLGLFANRFESFPPVLGGRSESVSENRGMRLFGNRLYIPSFLTVHQVLSRYESATAGVVSLQERERDVVRYEGQRGWTDREVDIHYEFIDEKDEVFPELGYRSHEGSVNYSLDFGTELNRHWDSRVRHFDRTGVSDLTTTTANELLWIDHTADLRSELRYAFARSAVAGGANSTHSGAATVRHQLYESVKTVADAGFTAQAFPQGTLNTYRGRLNVDYVKRLPADGRLDAGVGGGLEREDQKFDETEGFVTQETYTAASPFALPVALDRPLVTRSSVVVTKIAVGPLPPGCIAPLGLPVLLVEGQDYTLRPTGVVTEIVPLPCAGTAPGINPGDTIAVDYSFSTPAELAISTVSLRATVSIDYGWIRPFFSHEQSDQSLVSGRDGELLDDLLSDTVGIEFRHARGALRGELLTEAQRFRSDRLTYDRVRSTQHASVSVLPRLTLNVTGEQSRLEFENPARRRNTLGGRVSLTYGFGGSLVAEASGGGRVLEDSVFPRERVRDATFRVRWNFRKLEVGPTLEFFDRERGDTSTREVRFVLRAIRRF